MYFPYFRGRQYELLALTELAQKKLISRDHIMPVVEPIKISTTLKNMIQAYSDNNLCVSMVLNPTVGELCGAIDKIEALYGGGLFDKNHLIPALIMNQDALSYLKGMTHYSSNEIITLLADRDFLADYEEAFADNSYPRYTLIPDDRQFRRSKVMDNKILFEDKFNKKIKNSEYPLDEFFSDDYSYYKEEGYKGFGDYSIIGDEYSESGFAPYAVAIHIIYIDKGSMRIRHFISDSNFDISDVAGKFYEAVKKLYNWTSSQLPISQRTAGLRILLKHYENQTYPGLPTLKKLSIMHHLELVNKLLGGGIVDDE